LSVPWSIASATAVLAAISVVFLVLSLGGGGSVDKQLREQGKVADLFRSGMISHGGRVLPVVRMDPADGVTVLRDGLEVQVSLREIVPVRVARSGKGSAGK